MQIRATQLAFVPSSLSVRTGANVTLVMRNEDGGVPHDVGVRLPSGDTASSQCSGPCTQSLFFTAPAPGNYAIYCTVHPMPATLVVTP